MRHRTRSFGLHEDKRLERARAAFLELLGPDQVTKRQAEVDALRVVYWKGQKLRQIRCTGTSGKGPHVVNVPEGLLWSLLDWRRYRCPYHAND